MPQRDRLARLRAELADLADVEFNLSYNGSTVCIEKHDRKTGEFVMLAEFTDASSDEQQFLIGALDTIRFLFGLVDNGNGGMPKKDYAAQAAMLCDQPPFWVFLGSLENTGPTPRDKDEAATMLRSVLCINSRARLNDNPEAAARWKELESHFRAWRQV